MKKIELLFAVALLGGCAYNADNLSDMMRDPHYTHYQEASDELEHEFLNKKISYADYQMRKQELDNTYEKEVKIREEKMHEEKAP